MAKYENLYRKYQLTEEEKLVRDFNSSCEELIKVRQKQLGYTQKDLAVKSGVNRVTLASNSIELIIEFKG